jgi:hypothetical protein
MRAPSSVSLREAGETWIAGARDGTIRNRSGDRYKPSVIRGYEAAFRRRILPDLGARRLSDIRRSDVQDLADRLLAEGLDPSSIRNVLMPLRVIFRRAVAEARSQSTRATVFSSLPYAGAGSGSPRPRRPRVSSRPWAIGTVLSGRRRSTEAFAAVS